MYIDDNDTAWLTVFDIITIIAVVAVVIGTFCYLAS